MTWWDGETLDQYRCSARSERGPQPRHSGHAASDLNFTPGWVPRAKPILWAEPRPELLPAHWTYQEAKAGLDAAGRLIDVSLAERRNLVMRNPAPGTNFETTRTLVCVYQMVARATGHY